ncbi:MAG: hypothetical protein ACRDOU_01180 [Streptosporangiaceae bacterium]
MMARITRLNVTGMADDLALPPGLFPDFRAGVLGGGPLIPGPGQARRWAGTRL